jgi:hypothetical protein
VANVNAATVAFATEAANVTLQNPAETKGLFEARVVLVYKFLPTGLADVVSPQWHCFIRGERQDSDGFPVVLNTAH